MPIYDRTTNDVFSEIKKVYDFTSAIVYLPIKEIYDVTVNDVYSPVYVSEFVLLSNSPIVYIGSWSGATAEYKTEGRFLMRDYAGSHVARNDTLIDFSQFDTFTAERQSNLYDGSSWEGWGDDIPSINTIQLVDESGNVLISQYANEPGTHTHTFDIENINTSGYVEVVGHSFMDSYVTYWTNMIFS